MDGDTRMRDVSDKPGGRKGHQKMTHKTRSSHRPGRADALLGKDPSSSTRSPMVNSRLFSHLV